MASTPPIDIPALLKRIPLFSELSAADIERIAEALQPAGGHAPQVHTVADLRGAMQPGARPLPAPP